MRNTFSMCRWRWLLLSDIKSTHHAPIDIFEIKRYHSLPIIHTITNPNNYSVQISWSQSSVKQSWIYLFGKTALKPVIHWFKKKNRRCSCPCGYNLITVSCMRNTNWQDDLWFCLFYASNNRVIITFTMDFDYSLCPRLQHWWRWINNKNDEVFYTKILKFQLFYFTEKSTVSLKAVVFQIKNKWQLVQDIGSGGGVLFSEIFYSWTRSFFSIE